MVLHIRIWIAFLLTESRGRDENMHRLAATLLCDMSISKLYRPFLCSSSVLGAAVIETRMPVLKVLVTPVLPSLFQGRGFPVTASTFSPLQPTRSLFGLPRYAPSLSLFRPSPERSCDTCSRRNSKISRLLCIERSCRQTSQVRPSRG